MRTQTERAGTPEPKAIGIDEIAIRKGHNCRIVVSDLVHRVIDFVMDFRIDSSAMPEMRRDRETCCREEVCREAQ